MRDIIYLIKQLGPRPPGVLMIGPPDRTWNWTNSKQLIDHWTTSQQLAELTYSFVLAFSWRETDGGREGGRSWGKAMEKEEVEEGGH